MPRKNNFENLRLLSIFLGALGMAACAGPSSFICKNRIEFNNAQKISFNNNEKLFLCGDESHESWKEIPWSQAEYHLRTFLSKRGYYEPSFSFREKKLWVDPGKRLLATQLRLIHAPPEFDHVTLRDVVKNTLDSDLLDIVQNWTTQRLGEIGYPCPTVKVQASQETGEISVTVDSGPRSFFSVPEMEDSIGLNPESFRRFDAFTPNTPYRVEMLKLTENRAENDGMVVSSKMTVQCPLKDDVLHLKHQVLGGDPHLVTVGAGASTEEIPIVQASFKSVRLDRNGSSLVFTEYGSQRTERLQAKYLYFAFDHLPRLHLDPTLKLERLNEVTYVSSQINASVPLTHQADFEDGSWLTGVGPSIARIYSQQYGLNHAVTFVSMIGSITYTTHHYELYQNDPRMGSMLSFGAEAFARGFQSTLEGVVFRVSGSHLLEVNSVYPPQWILGLRYSLGTTMTEKRPSVTTDLPGQYFYTLGGDQNLRGFGRDEINHGTIGGLTSAFFGTEVRLAKSLPIGMEPFAFFDVGALGSTPLELDPSVYYSPGMGIRWSTPFGAIRSTLAHGYVTDLSAPSKLEHFQFFVSFGREF